MYASAKGEQAQPMPKGMSPFCMYLIAVVLSTLISAAIAAPISYAIGHGEGARIAGVV